MKTSALRYDLPSDLIAQSPAEPRDASRLMVIDRQRGSWTHHVFRDIVQFLQPNDLMVVNNTRVIPAKFAAQRATGATVGGLFLRELEVGRWEILAGNTKRVADGEWLNVIGDKRRMRIVERGERGRCIVDIDPPSPALEILEAVGATPLPPYIERPTAPTSAVDAADRASYQTIFANKPGAVAAPTAGLHFTDRVLQDIAEKGVLRAEVTLHVGTGTFAPVTVDDLSKHAMHSEWYDLPGKTATQLTDTKRKNGRIVAIGTTSVRVLESVEKGPAGAANGWTNLLIYPPYEFKNTDVLLTNFHLPESTLLALVSAFAGYDLVTDAYRAAVAERYRFFSYGDAMLIV